MPGRGEPNGGGLGVGQAVRLVGAASPGAAAASASARSLAAATGSSPLRSPRYGSQQEEHKPFKNALQNAPSRTRWLCYVPSLSPNSDTATQYIIGTMGGAELGVMTGSLPRPLSMRLTESLSTVHLGSVAMTAMAIAASDFGTSRASCRLRSGPPTARRSNVLR